MRGHSLVALLPAALLMGGCDWFSTMSRTDAIQPHEAAPLPPPERSVPLDGLPEFNLTTVEGMLTNPIPADSLSRWRGQAYYDTYCAVCHGKDGMGQGPIADKFPAIPPVAGATRFSDAYLFALVTQGRGLMPAYGQIPQAARWDVVNYLRWMTSVPGAASGMAPDTAGMASDTTAGMAPDTAGGGR